MLKLLSHRTILALSGAAGIMGSTAVWAHTGADGTPAHAHPLLQAPWAGFIAGLEHPLSGLDHLSAMMSVGLWSALRIQPDQRAGTRPSWSALARLPGAFAATMLVGALLAFKGVRLPGVEPMIAASLLALGLLLASQARGAQSSASILVGSFALFHGMAHGAELGGHPWVTLGGMLLATAWLHTTGIALGLALRERPTQASGRLNTARRWITRLTGAGVAGLGLSLLAAPLAGSM